MAMSTYLKLAIVFLVFALSGCVKNNEDEPDNPSSTPSSDVEYAYYVKYESAVSSIYIGEIFYTVNTDKGVQTFQSDKIFSEVFGPVKKGFKATIRADASRLHVANSEVRIYVCRGNEPFALKACKSGDKAVSVTYTIDF